MPFYFKVLRSDRTISIHTDAIGKGSQLRVLRWEMTSDWSIWHKVYDFGVLSIISGERLIRSNTASVSKRMFESRMDLLGGLQAWGGHPGGDNEGTGCFA